MILYCVVWRAALPTVMLYHFIMYHICCSSGFYVVLDLILLGLLRCTGSAIPRTFMSYWICYSSGFYVVLDLLFLGPFCRIWSASPRIFIRSAISPTYFIAKLLFCIVSDLLLIKCLYHIALCCIESVGHLCCIVSDTPLSFVLHCFYVVSYHLPLRLL